MLAALVAEVDSLPERAFLLFGPVLGDVRNGVREALLWEGEAPTQASYNAAVLRLKRTKQFKALELAFLGALLAGDRYARALSASHLSELQQVPVGVEKSAAKRYEAQARKYSADVERDIRLRLSRAVVAGEALTPKDFVDKLFRKYGSWADVAVTTSVFTVYNSAVVSSLRRARKGESGLLRMWDATLDARVCPYCRELHRVVVRVDQAFPGGVDSPPLHPRCRCIVVAWREDWDEVGQVRRVAA